MVQKYIIYWAFNSWFPTTWHKLIYFNNIIYYLNCKALLIYPWSLSILLKHCGFTQPLHSVLHWLESWSARTFTSKLFIPKKYISSYDWPSWSCQLGFCCVVRLVAKKGSAVALDTSERIKMSSYKERAKGQIRYWERASKGSCFWQKKDTYNIS